MTRHLAGLITAATIAACAGEDLAAPGGDAARVVSVAVAPNATNVLAAGVTVIAEHAESARVIFAAAGAPADTTPAEPLLGGQAVLPVLGLRAGTAYRGVVEVSGRGGRVRSDTVEFAAGELPSLLRRVAITVTGTAGPGLTLTALPLGGVALVAFAFDSSGAIRWYRRFDDPRVGGELKQQPNGNFTVYIGASFGSQPVPGAYVEFSPAGDSLRAFAAPPPLYTDNHELLITGSGDGERVHLFGYDHHTVDLSSIGGSAAASLAGHYLLRLRPDGSPEFAWSAWDHFRLDDWIEPPKPGPVDPTQPDFDHPNSLAFDRDGNYVVSWRNLGEITKIDARTGAIIWRLGGAQNQFVFLGDPLGGFSAQHFVRVLPNGHLLLYDNGTRHQPPETRVVEYALDTRAMTATMMWEFRHVPPIYTPYVGSVQRLADGGTAIGYGMAGHVTEVGPEGGVRWEADLRVNGQPAFAYRLLRIASLYHYATP